MERLTHEADFGLEDWEETLFFVKSDPSGAYNILDIAKYQGESEFDEILKNVALRLAAYENTGLEPETISKIRDIVLDISGNLDRLRELAQADREGRCVVLPAKTVFELTWDAGPGCDLVCPFSIDGVGQCDYCDHGKLFVYERPCRQEHIERIGADVFMTREEAEEALRREQE